MKQSFVLFRTQTQTHLPQVLLHRPLQEPVCLVHRKVRQGAQSQLSSLTQLEQLPWCCHDNIYTCTITTTNQVVSPSLLTLPPPSSTPSHPPPSLLPPLPLTLLPSSLLLPSFLPLSSHPPAPLSALTLPPPSLLPPLPPSLPPSLPLTFPPPSTPFHPPLSLEQCFTPLSHSWSNMQLEFFFCSFLQTIIQAQIN